MNNSLPQLITTKSAHSQRIIGVIKTPTGYLISWSEDQSLKVWSQDNISEVTTLTQNIGAISSVTYLSDVWIASTTYSGYIHIWDIEKKILYKKIERPESSFMGTVDYDHNYLVSWDLEGDLIIWNKHTGKLISIIEGSVHNYYQSSAPPPFILLPQQKSIVTWANNTLDFWDITTGEYLHGSLDYKHAPTGVIPLLNTQLLSWDLGNHFKVWNSVNSTMQVFSEKHENTANALLSNKKTLVSWSRNNSIKVWDYPNQQLLLTFQEHKDLILNIYIINEKFLLSCSIDQTYFVWNQYTGEIITTFNSNPHNGLILSNHYFLNWKSNNLILWNLKRGTCKVLRQEKEGFILGILPIHKDTIIIWTTNNDLEWWNLHH